MRELGKVHKFDSITGAAAAARHTHPEDRILKQLGDLFEGNDGTPFLLIGKKEKNGTGI